MGEFTYSLRIGICPDFEPETKFQTLLSFCEKAKIDDIIFIINMEEVNDGHLTREETKPWLEMLKAFRSRVKEKGMMFSLNPWTTTLHTDRGRKLKPGQNFVTMVDPDGQKATAVACPLDASFQEYIFEMYKSYAELGFDVIWVEDDFRLHNHAPLRWGGCFCELHLAEFERKIGGHISRDDFCAAVIQPGAPHSYRKVWLDTERETMCDFAALLGNAVHHIAPQTRIGLMSSTPRAHCTEGRDWKTIFQNLSGATRPLDRPHLPSYNENTGIRYCMDFQRCSRLTAAMVPEETELWPELDNLPHTRFSKSHTFAKLQIESSLALCSEGITINIFDMIGNGIAEKEKNDQMLAEIKPYLSAVKSLGAHLTQEQGIKVMYCPDSSYTIHTNGGLSPSVLEPSESFWAEYLTAFGIATVYCCDKNISGATIAVSGQYFRNLTETEIDNLFQNNFVFLNGDAAETLVEMGLGHYIGAKSGKWHSMNRGYHSYEQVANGKEYYSLPKARMSAQASDENMEQYDYYEVQYTQNPEVYTDMRSATGEYRGVGLCMGKNTVVFPYGHLGNSFLPLFNPVRRELMLDVLKKSPFAPPAVLKDAQYATVGHFDLGEHQMLFLLNFSTDSIPQVTLELPFETRYCQRVNHETGELQSVALHMGQGIYTIEESIAPLTSACFVLKKEHR